MARSERDPQRDAETALLGLEADASLREDPRLLHEPRRLGALHARLAESLGGDDARAVLLQAGFLHGLRDALRAFDPGWSRTTEAGAAGEPVAPRLTIALSRQTEADGLDLAGSWRERHEAEGRVAALGPSGAPSCFASAGYTSGWLSGLFGVDMLAVETECAASGAERCAFVARPADVWRAADDPLARRSLACLDFTRLHASLAGEAQARPESELSEAFDPAAPVVHVWGPVMVMPFAGADDSLAALELIGRDESARDVSVVVVDLGGAILDEGFGAVALERVLDAIEGWGADAVLTGVSPLSQPVVASLETRHLLVHKSLPEAIAAAFQIADAQRHVY